MSRSLKTTTPSNQQKQQPPKLRRFDDKQPSTLDDDQQPVILDSVSKDKLTKLLAVEIEKAISKAFSDFETRLALALSSPTVKPLLAEAASDAVNASMDKLTKRFEDRISALENKVEKLKGEQDDLDQYQRRWNLVLHGLPENNDENCAEIVHQLINTKLNVNLPASSLQRSHRLGTKTNGKRPIIVRFLNYSDRKRVYGEKKKLKGTGIVITENLTPTRLNLYKKVHETKIFTASWTMDGNVFGVFNGKVVRVSSLNDLSKYK